MTDAETNRKIAEARGYWYHANAWWDAKGTVVGSLPDYLHDANALHEALAALCSGYRVDHRPELGGVKYEVSLGHRYQYGKTFCDTGCKLILAVLAERKDAT